MRLFENIENTALSSFLHSMQVHHDRCPVASQLQTIISNDILRYLAHLGPQAINDVYLLRDGVACVRAIYFDDVRSTFKWHEMEYMYLNEGVTVYVRGLQRYFSEFRSLLSGLAPFFPGKRLFANLFVSPANAIGLRAHFDPTDFIVIQLSGSKLWTIWQRPPTIVADSMMPEQVAKYCAEIEERLPPSEEHLLISGEALYAQQYTIHAPRTTKDSSTHITVGLADPLLRRRLERWEKEQSP